MNDSLARRYEGYPETAWFVVAHKNHETGSFDYTSYQVADTSVAVSDLRKRPEENTYMTSAVFAQRPLRKGTREEVLGSRWLWVDVDSHGPTDPTPEQILTELRAFSPAPTMIVASGRGYQALWALDELITDREEIEGRNRWIKSHLHGSDNCQNIDRILRVPGTMNTRSNTYCVIVEDTRAIYSLNDFRSISASSYGPKFVEVNCVELPENFLETIQQRDKKLYNRIWNETSARKTARLLANGQIDRSVNDITIAHQLLGFGYSADEVASVLAHETWFSGSKFRERGFQYVERTVAEAVANHVQADSRMRNTDGSFSSQIAAASIMEKYHVKSFQGTLYAYVGNHYTKGIEYVVASELWNSLGPKMRSIHTVEVCKLIAQMGQSIQVDDSDAGNWVCLQNGVLNLETRALIPHTPDRFVPDMLPVEYHADADAAPVIEYLESVMGVENPVVFLEHLGHCLTYNFYTSAAHWLFLTGLGGSGKSELLEVVTGLLGEASISTVSMSELTAEKNYASGNLRGMRANVVDDEIIEGKFPNINRLKTYSSGKLIDVEAKFEQPSKARITAKFWFASNRPVELTNHDSGVDRRIISLACNRVWDPNEPSFKPWAGKSLVSNPESLSALLNLALEGLDRLRANHDYTKTEATKTAKEEWQYTTDPVVAFITDCTEDNPAGRIPVYIMYEHYKSYCNAAGSKYPLGRNKFNERLKEMAATKPDFNIKMGKGDVNGSTGNVWKGRSITDPQVGKGIIHTANGTLEILNRKDKIG